MSNPSVEIEATVKSSSEAQACPRPFMGVLHERLERAKLIFHGLDDPEFRRSYLSHLIESTIHNS